MHFYPGRLWLDTDGNPIQAHGGGILYDKATETYYWYGENKDGPTYQAHKNGAARVDIIGVSCYSSKDLWAWTNEGIVLSGDESNVTHDLYKSNVLERPKVIYNDKTSKYVMWMHIDDTNYTKASVGVAVSDSATGPFTYLYSMRPHGFDSRDMTIFKDDDGKAYLIYSSEENSELHVGLLTDNYLDLTREMKRVLVKKHREAPAVFKYEGTYYMITSGCSGWAPIRRWPMRPCRSWPVGDTGESLRGREQDLQAHDVLLSEYFRAAASWLAGLIHIHGGSMESFGVEGFEGMPDPSLSSGAATMYY
uniref:Glycosyl hydrolase family 32 N-terminal domain-containing protein n=1 Tax=Ananas comosus var. bracteatus TaxID=296719 RepID=A0A6V7PNJ4_ANACO|nr:unnamed protein product [Ananas comosus var. bracteatus]